MRALLACLLVTAACGSKSPPTESAGPPPASRPCIKTGCSGTVCAEEEVFSTCEYKPEYGCYRDAACERQPDGTCGWTESAELTACLANPPPELQTPAEPPAP